MFKVDLQSLVGQEHLILGRDSKMTNKGLWPGQPQCSLWVHGQRDVQHRMSPNTFSLRHSYTCWPTDSFETDGSLDGYWHWLILRKGCVSRLLSSCSGFLLHGTSCDLEETVAHSCAEFQCSTSELLGTKESILNKLIFLCSACVQKDFFVKKSRSIVLCQTKLNHATTPIL